MCFVRERNSGGKRPAESGYTLIEVLVATVIFAAMAILAGVALNQELRQYQGLVRRGLNFWGQAHKIWTDKSFHSIVNYYVCDTKNDWFPYFRGGRERVSYVTLAPLVGDLPVVVWVMKETLENGKSALVYYELPVYAKNYREIEYLFSSGAYRKGRSAKLIEEAQRIEIRYYGYDNRVGKHIWSETFDGKLIKNLPMFVHISYSVDGMGKALMYGIPVNYPRKKDYWTKYEQ